MVINARWGAFWKAPTVKKNDLCGLKYVDICVPVFLFFRTHTYTKDFMVFNQFRTSYIPADNRFCNSHQLTLYIIKN